MHPSTSYDQESGSTSFSCFYIASAQNSHFSCFYIASAQNSHFSCFYIASAQNSHFTFNLDFYFKYTMCKSSAQPLRQLRNKNKQSNNNKNID